jgi:hypothetical protein
MHTWGFVLIDFSRMGRLDCRPGFSFSIQNFFRTVGHSWYATESEVP